MGARPTYRGLCPWCGHDVVRHKYETKHERPDLRYNDNPLSCLACGWEGPPHYGRAAQELVEKRVAAGEKPASAEGAKDDRGP